MGKRRNSHEKRNFEKNKLELKDKAFGTQVETRNMNFLPVGGN